MSARQPLAGVPRLAFGAAWVIACLISSPVPAQERFAGQWVVAGAIVAPWASDPKDHSDAADARRLVGKRLAIDAKSFRAPQPLGCAKPSYNFRDATADTLFEGSLNADGGGKPADAVVVARSLGVNQQTVRGMTASCSEVEFFLIDPDTILFGLNNRVFTAKRAN